jgi:hypothetical protein
MKKVLIVSTLTLISLTSYGAVIPLVNVGNCTDITNQPTTVGACTLFEFTNPMALVNPGDTFNITCTFAAGNNNPGNVMPGDVLAFVPIPVTITSGPALPTDKITPIKTQGAASVQYHWTGVANEAAAGTFFGMAFNPPSNLQNNQTIKVSCVNN